MKKIMFAVVAMGLCVASNGMLPIGNGYIDRTPPHNNGIANVLVQDQQLNKANIIADLKLETEDTDDNSDLNYDEIAQLENESLFVDENALVEKLEQAFFGNSALYAKAQKALQKIKESTELLTDILESEQVKIFIKKQRGDFECAKTLANMYNRNNKESQKNIRIFWNIAAKMHNLPVVK